MIYAVKVDVDSKNPILAQKNVPDNLDMMKAELFSPELEVNKASIGDSEYTIVSDAQPFLSNKINISAFIPAPNIEDSGIFFGSLIICKGSEGSFSSLDVEEIDQISKNTIVMRTESGAMAPCVIFGAPFKNTRSRDKAVQALNDFIDFFNSQV